LGTIATSCLITSADRVSGLVNLNPPRFAFPTALRLAATIYAFIFFLSVSFLILYRLLK